METVAALLKLIGLAIGNPGLCLLIIAVMAVVGVVKWMMAQK